MIKKLIFKLKAYYKDEKIAGVRTTYGEGRVVTIGSHPETSTFWKRFKGLKDPDGSDQKLAGEQMKWAVEKDNN